MNCKYFLQKAVLISLCGMMAALFAPQAQAQQKLILTFKEAVDIAFDRSYDVYKRRRDYQRNALNNRAGKAALKSYSNLNVELPNFKQTITREYDSSEQKYKTFESERTTLTANWDVSQPTIIPILNYPTNGTFSFNTNLVSLSQKGKDRTYKNKLFLKFMQPLFTRNKLHKDLWRNELSFESTELTSISSLLTHYGSLSRLFHDLYSLTEEYKIESLIVEISESAYEEALQQFSEGRVDSAEVIQLEIDYLLSKNRLLSKDVELYKKELEFKQKFGLSFDQPVELVADLDIKEYEIDIDKAVEIGLKDRPSIRTSEIRLEFSKDQIEQTDARREFKADMIATYGFENSSRGGERFNDFLWKYNMLRDYNVTRSLQLSVTLPLWDNGKNGYDVEVSKLSYETSLMRHDNEMLTRENEIRSAYRTFMSSQQRAIRQRENIGRAKEFYEQCLERFRNNEFSAQELSRACDEYRNAQNLFLSAFISYQSSWVNFQQKTYWDWENNLSLKEKFRQYLQTY